MLNSLEFFAFAKKLSFLNLWVQVCCWLRSGPHLWGWYHFYQEKATILYSPVLFHLWRQTVQPFERGMRSPLVFLWSPPLPSHPSSIYLMGEKAWLGHHCPLGPGPSHMYTVVPIPQADYSEPSSAQERHLIHNKIWKLNYLLKSKIFNTFLQIYPRNKNNMTSSFRDTFETKV